MSFIPFIEAAVLGLIEGLTEFIPVSSTAHILLAGQAMGFQSPGKTFEVLIQLGAILAIMGVYAGRLTQLAIRIPHDPSARRFILAVLCAFLPAALVGVAAHSVIKSLFDKPLLICTMLILGGIILLWVDRWPPKNTIQNVEAMPLKQALIIGFCQCLAMIPGVSRSGATIVSALWLGANKRTAAEFSFYLAMPTMAGAFAYDLYKSYNLLSLNDVAIISIGFVMAFLSGLFVVKKLLDYVSNHGFALFGWWRIFVGSFGFGFFLIAG